MSKVWAGVDAGKTHHHCVVIDDQGRRLLSRRVANDEPELEALIADVPALGEVTWAADMPGGGAALLIGLLAAAGQPLLYLPGHALAHAAAGYRGEGKTDARDAAIIADQARMRRDLQPLRPGDEITAELKILTERRKDLSCDRARAINRMRALLSGIFPDLERGLDLTCAGGSVERAFDNRGPWWTDLSAPWRDVGWTPARAGPGRHPLVKTAWMVMVLCIELMFILLKVIPNSARSTRTVASRQTSPSPVWAALAGKERDRLWSRTVSAPATVTPVASGSILARAMVIAG